MPGTREKGTSAMQSRTSILVLAAILAAGCASASTSSPGDGASSAARSPEATPVKMPTEEEVNAAWMKTMNPGEPHAKLAAHAGTWDTVGKFWMKAGEPPMESKGEAKFSMLLGGRVERQEFKGDFMGMPFEGLGY